MTLLHLAASLGYSRLVCAMLHWRAENSSLLLETEVDALSQDEFGFTPLVRMTQNSKNYNFKWISLLIDVGLRAWSY